MLTPNEIAALTELSYRSVLREIEDGHLKAFRLRGRLRVEQDDFEDWLVENEVRPAIGKHWVNPEGPLRKQRPAGSLRTLHESTRA